MIGIPLVEGELDGVHERPELAGGRHILDIDIRHVQLIFVEINAGGQERIGVKPPMSISCAGSLWIASPTASSSIHENSSSSWATDGEMLARKKTSARRID
jgi:hypothetical protein